MTQSKNDNTLNTAKETRKPLPGEGLQSLRSTYAFRLINYELYAK